jgi:hypothetical protein
MTISSTTNTVSYTGNGSTTAFAVPYAFFGTGTTSEIQVVEVVIATGAETVKSNGSDYTVAGGSGTTGTVTAATAPASTVKWVINRATTQTQETDYVENDPFPAESHEEALDRLTAIDQEQQRALDRTAQLPDGYTGSFDPTLPVDITGSAVLAFNAGATAFEIGPTTAAISGAAAEAAAAAVSADDAAAEAAAAAVSADDAAAEAAAAAVSADDAAASAAAAATTYDNFDDRYLGQKATDPTLDNDGDALLTGALYFNTSNNVMMVYTGSAWVRTTPTTGEQTNINTVSGIAANVTTVAGIAADVTTTAGISADVTTVAADGTDIGTVAGISADVTTVAGVAASVPTVAGVAADVTTVAGISADVTTVAGVAASVPTVAGVAADVTTVAGISADVTTVAADGTDIGTVAGISADVTTVAADGTDIGTVAGISADVTTVAGVAASVPTVAGVAADVTTVAGISADVTTVAGIAADVTTTAGISADVTTVAADGTDIGTVAGISADVTTVAGIAADVTTTAGISADVTTVAADGTDIGTVAGISANVTTVAGISANVTTVAGIAANVTTVAGISADVTTAATNVTDITNFADVYIGPSASDPTVRVDASPLQAGDLYFNTTVDELRAYSGSQWVAGTVGTIAVQRYSGDGSTVAFTLATAPASENNTQVYVSGVYQQKDTYGVSGVTVTFSAAPPIGTNNIEIVNSSMGPATADTLSQILANGNSTGGTDIALSIGDKVTNFTSTGIDDNATSTAITINSSENVGIGTSSPAFPLDVQCDTAAFGLQLRGRSADNISVLRFRNNAADTTYFQLDIRATSSNLNTVANAPLFFSTNNTERMRIDSAGLVGIGTSSPVNKLDVSGAGTTTIAVRTTDTSGANIGRVRVDYTGGGGGGASQVDLRAGDAYTYLVSPTNTPMLFGTNNTERMRINSSGNVGIGTSSPTEKLDVVGNVTISGSLTKGSGSFKIDHPLKPDTHHLVHSFVEAPTADNIYRGSVDLVDGVATVDIDEAARLSGGTFVALNTNTDCWVNNKTGWTAVRATVSGSTLSIEAQDNSCADTVSWLVIGERHDQTMIDATWTDEAGRVITEPQKDK